MAETDARRFGPNFVPLPYRQVSVQPYEGEMTAVEIARHLLERDSYRRTRFVILHRDGACAIAAVERADERPLFSPITAVDALALPDTCVWADDEDVDTANPSALAAKAAALDVGPGSTLVVRGLDQHTNFIYHPAPLAVQLVDVAPPEPSKLLRMARQVLGYTDLPAIVLSPRTIDLRSLARQAPDATAYLLPCRAGSFELGVPTYFLDEHPERHDWTMLACERSCQIHRHFYGETAAPRIDFCPRNLVPPDGTPTLTKCCLLEDRIEIDEGQRAIVPWGATLLHVEQALRALSTSAQPAR